MTRRLLTAALALSVAGGVYMAGAPAQASNMGFKLERDINYLRNPASPRPLKNIYLLSFPYFNGLGDVANTGHTGSNKCVGDAAGGPLVGDGTINADDAICDLWTARIPPSRDTSGTFAFGYYRRSDCALVSRIANIGLGSTPAFPPGGYASPTLFPPDDGDGDPSNNEDLWTDRAYQINLDATPTGTNDNRAIIVGSHDPAFPGQQFVASLTCGARAAQIDLLAVPYHSMYRNALEFQCGLEFTDWTDDGLAADGTPAGTDGDGEPDHFDECDTSLFDGANLSGGVRRPPMQVGRFVNEIPPAGLNGLVSCTVSESLNRINFSNCRLQNNFPFVPGEGFQVNIDRTQTAATTFLSPHF